MTLKTIGSALKDTRIVVDKHNAVSNKIIQIINSYIKKEIKKDDIFLDKKTGTLTIKISGSAKFKIFTTQEKIKKDISILLHPIKLKKIIFN